MELEERPPNKPNFTLIVALFAVAILLILLVSYLFVRRAETHMPDGQKAAACNSVSRFSHSVQSA